MKYLLILILLIGCSYREQSEEATKAVESLSLSVKILKCTVKVSENKVTLQTEADRCARATHSNKDFCIDHIKMYIDQETIKCLQENY